MNTTTGLSQVATGSTIESLAFDGPISFQWTALLAISLTLLFIWSLYRERSILGGPTTLALSALRLIAVGTVLWMLLAPTSVIEQTTTTRKSIAIIADVSGSMDTIDPVGTADDLRWYVSSDADQTDGSLTQWADQSAVALAIAGKHLASTIEAVSKHRDLETIGTHAAATQRSIDHAKQSLDRIRQSIEPLRSDSAPEKLLQRCWRMLDSPEYSSFAKISQTLSTSRMPIESTWRESLEDLGHHLSSARNVMRELTRELAVMETGQAVAAGNATWNSLLTNSRAKRVTAVLQTFRSESLAATADFDVRWGRFDEIVESLPEPKITQDADLAKMLLASSTDSSSAERSAREVRSTNVTGVLEQLRRLQKQQPIAAAFIFSDVAHNASSQSPGSEPGIRLPTEAAGELSGTPVYVIPIGNAEHLRDVHLVAVEAPPVAMRNDDIVIEAHLQAHQCSGETCTVQLIEEDEVIDFREVPIDSDFVSRTVRFNRRVPEIRRQAFTIRIQGVDGELTLENNEDQVEINVTRSDIKVLLADDMPRWEYRYLTQLFRRDPKIDCDELLFRPRIVATGKRQSSQALPETLDQWDQYDVVILGDVLKQHLASQSQASLIDYVRKRGGTLILIAGSQAMPQAYADDVLASIVPVQPLEAPQASVSNAENGFAFRVSEEGKKHVALMVGETQAATAMAWEFVNRFAPLHEVSVWSQPKPTAHNLIWASPKDTQTDESIANDVQTDSSTFLCWQPIGRGRVVYLSGPETYRLRFLRGDQLHYRFWGQLLRWAIASDLSDGSQLIRVRANKSSYQTGETARVELQLLDREGLPLSDQANIQLAVTSENDSIDEAVSKRTVPMIADADMPGLYVGQIVVNEPGTYHAEPIGKIVDALRKTEALESASSQNETDLRRGDEIVKAMFRVETDPPMEMIDTRCDLVLASQIAELTGGETLPPTAIAEVLKLTDLSPVVTRSVQRSPLWTRWKFLWLVFGCLQTEWIVRNWRGLS